MFDNQSYDITYQKSIFFINRAQILFQVNNPNYVNEHIMVRYFNPLVYLERPVKGLFLLHMLEVYYTYVLYSIRYDKIYIGFTSDLKTRLLSHNTLATKGWTIRFRPWEILFYEEFSTKAEAIKREK